MRQFLGALVLALGGILGVAGLALLGEAVSAWVERFQHGSGPMFADAEIFLGLGLVAGALGALALWAGVRLIGGARGKAGD
ncbi:MAG: hypothetical protein MUE39_00555 [Gammaproteobacteria bacterium]|nr:hypothetical protein [Gammaproteobacteria bacterium]